MTLENLKIWTLINKLYKAISVIPSSVMPSSVMPTHGAIFPARLMTHSKCRPRLWKGCGPQTDSVVTETGVAWRGIKHSVFTVRRCSVTHFKMVCVLEKVAAIISAQDWEGIVLASSYWTWWIIYAFRHKVTPHIIKHHTFSLETVPLSHNFLWEKILIEFLDFF